MNSIPTVDLAHFTSTDPAIRMQFVQDLGTAFQNVGFVAVRNHGISESVIAEMYEQVKRFYALPIETKLKYEVPGLAGQRGYTSFGKEKAKHSAVGDLKEFWQYGQVVTDQDPIEKEYPTNVSGPEIEVFNAVFAEAYRAFEKSGGALLEAIALFLGLEGTYFNAKVHNGNSILRAIHYPPILNEPQSAIRAEQHEDINLITLLIGASADGLEVLSKENKWVAVSSMPEQIVVNVGDMLQRLTNNNLRSTTHRVVNPPRELWHTSRFSIPFFLHPRSEMRLDCLSSCISESNAAQYQPISAGEYLDERLIEIGLKNK
jgi:isopenicillin N synthase-like dioxygenase